MEPVSTSGTTTGSETATTETVSATKAAADAGNVSAFLEADSQARAGKPLAKVERPATPGSSKSAKAGGTSGAPAGAKPATGPTEKDRETDERLVSRIREAVDTATASSRAEIAELKRELSTRKPADGAGTKDGAAAGPTRLEIKHYLAMPDAPKLDDKNAAGEFLYDSAPEHAVAVALFIQGKQRLEERDASTGAERQVERTKREVERVTSFSGRIDTFKKTDPDFGKRLSADVVGLHGFARLEQANAERQKQGLAPLPATVDHAIGELIYDSEVPAQVGLYLSEHPEALGELRKATSPAALAKAFGRIEDKAGTTTAAAASADADTSTTNTTAAARKRADEVVDRSLSSAKPPETNLGKGGGAESDPYAKAVSTGDVGLFLELDLQRMQERRGPRAAAR